MSFFMIKVCISTETKPLTKTLLNTEIVATIIN